SARPSRCGGQGSSRRDESRVEPLELFLEVRDGTVVLDYVGRLRRLLLLGERPAVSALEATVTAGCGPLHPVPVGGDDRDRRVEGRGHVTLEEQRNPDTRALGP